MRLRRRRNLRDYDESSGEEEQKNDRRRIPYTEQTQIEALAQIDEFEADFGGTFITGALADAQRMDSGDAQKRIFLLTDGEVGNRQEVVEQARRHCQEVRVFTFGLGDCDKRLCIETAEAGRGSCSIVKVGS